MEEGVVAFLTSRFCYLSFRHLYISIFFKHVHFCFVHESYDTHLCSRRLLIRLVNGKEARIDASRPFVRSLQRIERCFDRRYIKRERENENKAFWNQNQNTSFLC